VKIPSLLQKWVDEHPYPLVFATVSGAHLYGFPSADSDFDLRGAHRLPLEKILGLDAIDETVESSGIRDGVEADIVSHDVKKFMGLMLRKNGYVLEQLFSPLVVRSSPWHAEMKSLGEKCITKFHSYHYLGFAETQWKLWGKESPRRVKPLLYVLRVLLTGIHLMRTGRIEANLVALNEDFKLSYVPDLIARKTGGKEKQTLPEADAGFFEREYLRLRAELEAAHEASTLPEAPGARAGLSDLLVRIRRS
jgi:predicted nucleotidyltransferase